MKWTCVTLLWLSGCAIVGPDASDLDGDGFVSAHYGGDDCDDADASVHPGAREIPVDGVDQDCDGVELCHVDADGDGLGGDALIALVGTSCHEGALTSGDCDDGDPTVQRRRYHRDADGDGHGDPDAAVEACAPPAGHVESAHDCDDADPALPRPFHPDGDGDGVGAGTPVLACVRPVGTAPTGGDCDDDDPERHPGAVEVCGDGVDQDCDPGLQICGLWGSVPAASADARWWGDHEAWRLGAALHGRTDVTGDGTPDLVIGAPGTWLLHPAARSGAVWVASGHALVGAAPASELQKALHGVPGESLGTAVHADAAVGELLIGAPGVVAHGDEVGAVERVRLPVGGGAPGDRILGVSRGGTIGHGVAVARLGSASPHVLVVGAHAYDAPDLVGWSDVTRWAGDVRLASRAWLPPVSGVLWAADDLAIEDVAAGPAPDGGDAWAYAFVDAERVGAVWASGGSGAYEVPLADLPGLVLAAPRRSAHEGELARVRVAHDLTGDRRADLVVGIACVAVDCPRRGDVWVVPGEGLEPGTIDLDAVGRTRPGFRLQGPEQGGQFGGALATADVDGDGHDDLWVGATSDGIHPGAVHLLYGPLPHGTFHVDDVGTVLPGARLEAPDSTSWRILALAGVADVDGDGRDEIAVGAPYDANPGGHALAGQVWVWHGRGDG